MQQRAVPILGTTRNENLGHQCLIWPTEMMPLNVISSSYAYFHRRLLANQISVDKDVVGNVAESAIFGFLSPNAEAPDEDETTWSATCQVRASVSGHGRDTTRRRARRESSSISS